MASKTYAKIEREAGKPLKADTGLRRVSHKDVAQRLRERIAELAAEPPQAAIPRNPGTRRTPSKRALLKAIEEVGGKW